VKLYNNIVFLIKIYTFVNKRGGKCMARVMIVDDAEFMRMVIKDTLLKHGHEVVAEAGDGEEAIQTYLEVKPDIVLMDVIMPDMNGKKALQKLLAMDLRQK
jgi:two-component system, chemotaxis family, chemotaxis protein CheY